MLDATMQESTLATLNKHIMTSQQAHNDERRRGAGDLASGILVVNMLLRIFHSLASAARSSVAIAARP